MAEEMEEVPRVDIAPYVLAPASDEARQACLAVAAAFRDVGVLRLVHPHADLGLTQRLRARTLDFYRLPEEEKRKMECRETGHNLGWTPSFTEGPRSREEIRSAIPAPFAPAPLSGKDPKERYMIPVGPAPVQTAYPEYNHKGAVAPAGFEDWLQDARTWSDQSLDIVFTLIRMATLGMDVQDPDLFTRLLANGPHVFGPTGCDLSKHGKPGTVHAGFHTDMGFGTIHGPSNCPGLIVYPRSLDRKIHVRMRPDELLFQVGKQAQICSGGAFHAGFHEVVANEGMQALVEAEQAAGRVPWRVSVTMFVHVASDQMLQPLAPFDSLAAREAYADNILLAGDRMRRQLKKRGLEEG